MTPFALHLLTIVGKAVGALLGSFLTLSGGFTIYRANRVLRDYDGSRREDLYLGSSLLLAGLFILFGAVSL